MSGFEVQHLQGRRSSSKPSRRSLGRQFRFLSPEIVLFAELLCQLLSRRTCYDRFRANLKRVGVGLPG
ncbi:uncharacterized [Tachysurus ichikawai]